MLIRVTPTPDGYYRVGSLKLTLTDNSPCTVRWFYDFRQIKNSLSLRFCLQISTVNSISSESCENSCIMTIVYLNNSYAEKVLNTY